MTTPPFNVWLHKTKDCSMRQELKHLYYSYVYVLLYASVWRLHQSTHTGHISYTKFELTEWVDYSIAKDVKITSHQLSRNELSHRLRVVYNNDTADPISPWYTYMCEILLNHYPASVKSSISNAMMYEQAHSLHDTYTYIYISKLWLYI